MPRRSTWRENSCRRAPDDLDIVDGVVVRRDRSGRPLDRLGEVARHCAPGARPAGREPGLSAEGWHHDAHQVYPYGSNIAVVRVDRETGGVAVERYYRL